MKKILYLLVLIFLISCTTTSYIEDDVYYKAKEVKYEGYYVSDVETVEYIEDDEYIENEYIEDNEYVEDGYSFGYEPTYYGYTTNYISPKYVNSWYSFG